MKATDSKPNIVMIDSHDEPTSDASGTSAHVSSASASAANAADAPKPILVQPEPSYAPDPDWQQALSTHGTPPRPKPTLRNAIHALRHAPAWHNVLSYNEFTHCLYLRSAPPWEAWLGPRWRQRPWTERDDGEATIWMQEHGIDVSLQIVSKAIEIESERRSYSSLLDFLNDLEWDNWHRIDTWLSYYLGAPDNEFTRSIGQRWLISAVARAFQPGCKADHCLILEGRQGLGKSTALSTLAGDGLFTDYISDELGSKEAALLCAGVWIIEFSELEGILHRPSRMETVKAFLTRTHDRYRPHYAKHPVMVPRQCVFAATTNQQDYFSDSAGNRRFWPVRCGKINTASLARDREQLWAEAVKCFLDGQSWWLDDEQQAQHEQADRLSADPWDESIAAWITKRRDASTNEILCDCMKLPMHELGRSEQMRVAKILHRMGWERFKDGNGRMRFRPSR